MWHSQTRSLRATIIITTKTLYSAEISDAFMEEDQFRIIQDLLILLLIKSGVSYEAIAEVTHVNVKTIQNRFPIGTVMRKRENV